MEGTYIYNSYKPWIDISSMNYNLLELQYFQLQLPWTHGHTKPPQKVTLNTSCRMVEKRAAEGLDLKLEMLAFYMQGAFYFGEWDSGQCNVTVHNVKNTQIMWYDIPFGSFPSKCRYLWISGTTVRMFLEECFFLTQCNTLCPRSGRDQTPWYLS